MTVMTRRYENVVFLQGDDYKGFERELYPGSTAEQLSKGFLMGSPDRKAAFEYLMQWESGEGCEETGQPNCNPYYFTTAGKRCPKEPRNGYAMEYHTGLSHAGLTRITEVGE